MEVFVFYSKDERDVKILLKGVESGCVKKCILMGQVVARRDPQSSVWVLVEVES
jgi:hypothetical protein